MLFDTNRVYFVIQTLSIVFYDRYDLTLAMTFMIYIATYLNKAAALTFESILVRYSVFRTYSKPM